MIWHIHIFKVTSWWSFQTGYRTFRIHHHLSFKQNCFRTMTLCNFNFHLLQVCPKMKSPIASLSFLAFIITCFLGTSVKECSSSASKCRRFYFWYWKLYTLYNVETGWTWHPYLKKKNTHRVLHERICIWWLLILLRK